jgi:hypothetical protein
MDESDAASFDDELLDDEPPQPGAPAAATIAVAMAKTSAHRYVRIINAMPALYAANQSRATRARRRGRGQGLARGRGQRKAGALPGPIDPQSEIDNQLM